MLRRTRIAGVLVGMTMAGVLATGVGQAAAAEADVSLGPYELLSSCLSAGNQGMDEGQFEDYECVGGFGAWYIDPQY
jgi:hypothetical protein